MLHFYFVVASVLLTAHSCSGKLFPCRTKVTWVNGIAHLPEHMSDPTFVISTIFGGVNVDYCHNPSAMTSESDTIGFVKDGIQAGSHVMMGRFTPEVDNLVEHLRAALAQVGRTGRVIHIAHSQGSVITWLAAQRLKPEECKRIEVISFGGAATICTSEFPFARCINYYAVNDPILNVVPSAVKALKSGFAFGDGMQQEIIFLATRTGDPVTDHGLLNPTYLEALVWEGQRYQSLFMSPIGQTCAAFVGPLSSTVTWFPNFAYETTRKAFIAIVRICTLLWELVQAALTRLLSREEKYEPILMMKTS